MEMGMTSGAVPPTQAASAELLPGAILPGDRYRVRRVLGRGGTAITYEADDLKLGRPVAVKELFAAGGGRVGGGLPPPPPHAAGLAPGPGRVFPDGPGLAPLQHARLRRGV